MPIICKEHKQFYLYIVCKHFENEDFRKQKRFMPKSYFSKKYRNFQSLKDEDFYRDLVCLGSYKKYILFNNRIIFEISRLNTLSIPQKALRFTTSISIRYDGLLLFCNVNVCFLVLKSSLIVK